MEKFLTLTEVAKLLGIGENEAVKLADNGQITAYRIGGNFLRFKLRDIDEYRKKISDSKRKAEVAEIKPKEFRNSTSGSEYSLRDRVYDFLYYHDFYIVVGLLIMLLLIIIFKF